MTDQEILELAAILVREHGSEARRVAAGRWAPYAHNSACDSYLLWTKIGEAVERILRAAQRQTADNDCS